MSLGAVQTAPEELLIKGFTLKTHQMFFVHTIPEVFKKTTVSGLFGFEFIIEEHSVRKLHDLGKVIKMFPA